MLLVSAYVLVVTERAAILLVSRELLYLSLWTVAHILEVSVKILPFLSLVVELLILISSLCIPKKKISNLDRISTSVSINSFHYSSESGLLLLI